MIDHVANQTRLIAGLRAELVGPEPNGPEIAPNRREFASWKDADGPWRQAGSGEEILTRDPPTKRYGVGVLFPREVQLEQATADGEGASDESSPPDAAPVESLEIDPDIPAASAAEAETEDFDLSMANTYQPSSMGVSFLAEFPQGAKLVAESTGGRYFAEAITVDTGDGKPKRRNWWLRSPVKLTAEFTAHDLTQPGQVRLIAATTGSSTSAIREASGVQDLDLRIELVSRPHAAHQRLITVCVVNRTPEPARGGPSPYCLFQARLVARVEAPEGGAYILPYPERPDDLAPSGVHLDPLALADQRSQDLLYRHAQMFATGHGCSADWTTDEGKSRASNVIAECLPATEVPGITPEIQRSDGSRVSVSMAALAGLVPGDNGFASLQEVIDLYESWIVKRRAAIPLLPPRYQQAATDHMDQCARVADRMRDGLSYLRNDKKALRAFQLANHAILLQQIVATSHLRKFKMEPNSGHLSFERPREAPDVSNPPSGKGTWRPFQVAFLLSTLRSTGEGISPDRRTVELIWFPTGGGKTEAYSGLAAFSMFKRRLEDPSDSGVHVLMRYTLRLLTAQQFQRASALICSMEYLRRQNGRELGQVAFSAGIWVGGETTPNSRESALAALSELERYSKAKNQFLLLRCPWCGAEFGRAEIANNRSRGHQRRGLAMGYVRQSSTVLFKCPDQSCDFTDGLPIHVIDEDIYEIRPTLVIGTIDKFAMLAWRPQARALFGLDANGDRDASPPGLIIQDELHLIAGPLGSLAGLYETVIEELCIDRRGPSPTYPKIVSSTATIRRYADQIRRLYARDDVVLFPPPGLDAGDFFFATYDVDRPGRVYVGVHAVSLGSVQTEWVRTFASLLQAPQPLEAGERDPWWTMMVFFNSIREMGTAHTLFQSDVPDYLRVIWSRRGLLTSTERRKLSGSRVFELTGGLSSGEIADAISKLETATDGPDGAAIDVCLASSVIEVGVDIPRLSLMVVAGQPKTTSQYIQVTGRVGRLRDRPALIVCMYSPSKPRDRSHFERFRGYHERLYAHVEPTSVTPFSTPAVERALHAALVIYARQLGDQSVASSPYPYPASLLSGFTSLLPDRVKQVDPSEMPNVQRILNERLDQWRDWQRTHWSSSGNDQDIPQLRVPGEYASELERNRSWATPTSMRNVDAECVAEITTLYIDDNGAGNA